MNRQKAGIRLQERRGIKDTVSWFDLYINLRFVGNKSDMVTNYFRYRLEITMGIETLQKTWNFKFVFNKKQ